MLEIGKGGRLPSRYFVKATFIRVRLINGGGLRSEWVNEME
jgi:hypothetical protein